MEFNFENDVAIDPDDLAEEWLRHPGLFLRYSMEVTEADTKVKKAHELLKVTRAVLIKEAKEEGAKNDAEREAYYRTHPDHKQAKKDLNEAEYEHSMLQNAVSAFYRKEKSLEHLVALLKMEYWAGPNEPKEISGGKRFTEKAKESSGADLTRKKRGQANRRRRTS